MEGSSRLLERKNVVDILIGVMALAAIILVTSSFYIYKNPTSQTPSGDAAVVSQEPVKTDFGTEAPDDFPTDIPTEEGVTVEQSYSLNYVGQKQLTIVFASAKTVKENYALYTDFFAKQGWVVSNTYESSRLSSLYGTKESNEMNVTISERSSSAPVKSQVSISILKK